MGDEVLGGMKTTWNFNLLGREIDIAVRVQHARQREMYGFTNLCFDGQYIVLFDFDGFEQEWVERIVESLQELYTLSTAYLFRSSATGWHAVIFDKLPIKYLVSVLQSASCDPNFVFVPLYYGKRLWSLRLTEKEGKRPVFVKAIKSSVSLYKKSRAHMLLIEKLYHIKVDKSNSDDSEEIVVSGYKI